MAGFARGHEAQATGQIFVARGVGPGFEIDARLGLGERNGVQLSKILRLFHGFLRCAVQPCQNGCDPVWDSNIHAANL